MSRQIHLEVQYNVEGRVTGDWSEAGHVMVSQSILLPYVVEQGIIQELIFILKADKMKHKISHCAAYRQCLGSIRKTIEKIYTK